MLTDQYNRFKINTATIGFILLVFINLLPDDYFHFFELYKSTTPSYINYKWLNYSFGLLDLVLVLFFLYLVLKRKNRWLLITSIILVFREILFLLFTNDNIFSNGSFEIYLCVMSGIALIAWQFSQGANNDEKWNKFLIILIINVLSIFLNVLFARNRILGRFNAVNLDVGTTGVVAGVAFISILFNENFKNRMLWTVVVGTGLVLSGSRVNLLITICLSIVYILVYFPQIIKKHNLFKFRVSTLIVVTILLIVVVFYGAILIKRFEASRLLTLFVSDDIDAVVSGRPDSFIAGLKIIQEHPFGISAYFTNLQYNTVREGFVTFPHFGFLVQYIFWGPLFIVPLFFIVRTAILLFKNKNYNIFFPYLYLILYNTIAGGPIVNPKIIYIFGFIFCFGYYVSKDYFVNKIIHVKI